MKTLNIGNKPIRDGQTVQVDHLTSVFVLTVQQPSNLIKDAIQEKFEVVLIDPMEQADTFRLVVRSLSKVGEDSIRDVVSKRFPVIDIRQTDELAMVYRPWDFF